MRTSRGFSRGGALALVGVLLMGIALSGAFVLPADQQGVVLRLGKVVRSVREAGLYFKIPFMDSLVRYPKRLLEYDAAPVAVVASRVEREGFRDEERPRIAGGIRNRREKGMPLQIAATVVYAWKKTGRNVTRVLYKDLEIESPYNTYRISGLPPGPICIPSEKSWLAALSPEKNEYLYYVAREDGSHIFAKTYSEHVKNIRKARGK